MRMRTRLIKLVTIAWMAVAILMLYWTLAVGADVWKRILWTIPGGWTIFTRLTTILLVPVAAVQVWRQRDSGPLLLLVIAGNALPYHIYYVAILGSTWWPIIGILILSVFTLGLLAKMAVASLRGHG